MLGMVNNLFWGRVGSRRPCDEVHLFSYQTILFICKRERIIDGFGFVSIDGEVRVIFCFCYQSNFKHANARECIMFVIFEDR